MRKLLLALLAVPVLFVTLAAADLSGVCLGGHLKTGHWSTLQNRPPPAWWPRPSVV